MNQAETMKISQSLVTEEAVKEALRTDKGPNAQLTSWRFENFTKLGDNYIAMVTSIRVEFALDGKDGKTSYVAKLNPCHGREAYEELTQVFFQKETEFYSKLLPRLNCVLEDAGLEALAMPKCVYVSQELNKEMLFLEDLRPRGFKMCDRRKGLNADHTSLVLKELAKLHAASLLLEKKDPEYYRDTLLHKGWANFVEGSINAEAIIGPYVDTSVSILEKVGGYEASIRWFKGIKPELQNLFLKQSEPSKYHVICHGDSWVNNLLFRYNDEGIPEEVKLVDLQLCRRESFAIDLNYFLYSSLPGDVRKPNLETFLEIYRKEFNAVMEAGGGGGGEGGEGRGGEEHFAFLEVLKEFRNKNDCGAVLSMMIVSIIMTEPQDVEDISGDTRNILKELRKKTLEMVDTNPNLRPRFLALHDEFVESGLIPL